MQNNTEDCACSKQLVKVKKEISELKKEIQSLKAELAILRKAVKNGH